jgi:hypothetical protein
LRLLRDRFEVSSPSFPSWILGTSFVLKLHHCEEQGQDCNCLHEEHDRLAVDMHQEVHVRQEEATPSTVGALQEGGRSLTVDALREEAKISPVSAVQGEGKPFGELDVMLCE